MDVEKKILTIIPYLLGKYDKNRKGVTIDIGVGTFNFYCEIFKNEGFKTFAVEPLPSENLKQLVIEKGIHLINACITNFNGRTKIYSGQFNGSQLTDLSSLHKTWWGVNDQSNVTEVDSLKLDKFISDYFIKDITYLKIDTEGSEWEIISQFPELNKANLPAIVEFEYGGGAYKYEQSAGWMEEYFSKTLKCINTLKQCGYKYVLVYEREENNPVFYNINSLNDLSSIFKDSYHYGNLIFFKENKFRLRKVNLIFSEKLTLYDSFKKLVLRIKHKLIK